MSLWVVGIWWLINTDHMNKAILLCTDSKTAVHFKNIFGRTDFLCNHGNISTLLLFTVLLWFLRIWWYIKTMSPSIMLLLLLKLSSQFTLSYFILTGINWKYILLFHSGRCCCQLGGSALVSKSTRRSWSLHQLSSPHKYTWTEEQWCLTIEHQQGTKKLSLVTGTS